MRSRQGRTHYQKAETYADLVTAVKTLDRPGREVPCMRPDSDPELWFTGDERSDRRAKALCGGCPVVMACLRHAMVWHEIGVWGATTQRERNAAGALRRSI